MDLAASDQLVEPRLERGVVLFIDGVERLVAQRQRDIFESRSAQDVEVMVREPVAPVADDSFADAIVVLMVAGQIDVVEPFPDLRRERFPTGEPAACATA